MVELPTLGRAELLLGDDWSQPVVAELLDHEPLKAPLGRGGGYEGNSFGDHARPVYTNWTKPNPLPCIIEHFAAIRDGGKKLVNVRRLTSIEMSTYRRAAEQSCTVSTVDPE